MSKPKIDKSKPVKQAAAAPQNHYLIQEDKLEPDKPSVGGGPRTHDLLIKELEERYHNSRFIAHAFMMWYTFFIALNLVTMGAGLTNFDKIKDIRLYIVVVFSIFNLLGVLATYYIYRGTKNERKRIDKIIKELNELCENDPTQRAVVKMETSYPNRLLMRVLSWLFGFSFLVLIIFWWIGYFGVKSCHPARVKITAMD
jgi:hypothetical protein